MALKPNALQHELMSYGLRQAELQTATRAHLNVPVDYTMLGYAQEKLGFQPNDIAKGAINRSAIRLRSFFVRNPEAMPEYVAALADKARTSEPDSRSTFSRGSRLEADIQTRLSRARTPEAKARMAQAITTEAMAKVAVEGESIRALMSVDEVRLHLRTVDDAMFTDSRSEQYASRPRTKAALARVNNALDARNLGSINTLDVLSEEVVTPSYATYQQHHDAIPGAQKRFSDAQQELAKTIEITQPFALAGVEAQQDFGRSSLS